MKCDHIRTKRQGDAPFFPNMLNNANVEVCLKEDVYAAIAELKQKLHDAEMRADLAESAETERKIDYDNLKAEFQKQKEAYAKLDIDYQQRLGFGFCKTMAEEHRQTLRALWLARAERARCTWKYYAEFLVFPREAEMKRWKKVEQLCRAKAEEYK